MSHASWLKPLFEPALLKASAELIAEEINKDKKALHIRAIAVRGISGAAIGGLISYLTQLPLIVVRKDNDGTHSSQSVEFSDKLFEKGTYVIVDDLIASGNTIRKIIDGVRTAKSNRLAKIYLYCDCCLCDRKNPEFKVDDHTLVPICAFDAK